MLRYWINPLNAELNPICHLLALVGDRHILHVSRIRVKLFFLFSLITQIFRLPGLTVSCFGSLQLMIKGSNTLEITGENL